jgi:N utilization substance protein A
VRLINPDERQAHVLVPDDQLSLAIGKEGQNVRLAARLTGWKIDIKDIAKYDYEAETRKMEALLEERRLAREAALAEEEDYEEDYNDYESEEEEELPLEDEAEEEVEEIESASADGFGSETSEALQRPQ